MKLFYDERDDHDHEARGSQILYWLDDYIRLIERHPHIDERPEHRSPLLAGPGSCAGTAHEAVFKAVASLLRGESRTIQADALGGPF